MTNGFVCFNEDRAEITDGNSYFGLTLSPNRWRSICSDFTVGREHCEVAQFEDVVKGHVVHFAGHVLSKPDHPYFIFEETTIEKEKHGFEMEEKAYIAVNPELKTEKVVVQKDNNGVLLGHQTDSKFVSGEMGTMWIVPDLALAEAIGEDVYDNIAGHIAASNL